jgi:hypothetical protein
VGSEAGVAAIGRSVVGKVPQTIGEVGLKKLIEGSGMNLSQAGKFFGWGGRAVTKGIANFTKEQLLANGWTKARLLAGAKAYEHVARITPQNPSAAGRAKQLRELATLFK